MYKILISLTLVLSTLSAIAQPVPAVDENIPYLVTFGKDGETAWGDTEFCQVIFFNVPEGHDAPVFIRVFDPEVGGTIDEQKGEWNTRTKFSIYGGLDACSNEDAQNINKEGEYNSGTLLASKTFGNQANYDGKSYAFGPFNPTEGEYLQEYGGYSFKIIIEGLSGDDGNLYRLFLSSLQREDHAIEGAFAYYFKYKFRLHDDVNEVSHIYPYIESDVVALKQSNFDWDNDGIVRIISVAKNGELLAISGDDEWAESTHTIDPEEKNTSYDLQIIKDKKANIKNNNVIISLANQRGEVIKFYSIPMGGIPKYKYKIGIKSMK